MSWVAVAVAGGAAIGAGGSMLQGQASGRGARAQRDFYDKRTGEGYQRYVNALYGPSAGNPAAWSVPGGAPPTPSAGSILGRLRGLADYGEGQGQSILAGYNADSGRLGQMARGAESMAGMWGQGREKIIRQDSGEDLRDRNDASRAALGAAGFGSSTAVGNQLSANAESVGRNRDRALQDLGEAQIDRQLGARTQRLNVEGGRSSGRTGLQAGLLSQNIGLRQAPISTELGAMESPIANPWLHYAGAYQPSGRSGLGEGLQQIGGLATSYGGYVLGQQQTNAGAGVTDPQGRPTHAPNGYRINYV